MKKVLITGFDPFNGEMINPSFEAVKQLPDFINEIQIIKLEIPTIFNQSHDKTVEAIKKYCPDVVIHVGQAGGRSKISVERVALNIDDARIPDNIGQQPIDLPINDHQDAALFSTLPVKRIVHDLEKLNIPVELSNTAGTFVCNHVMFSTLSYIKDHQLKIRAGFIHVPYVPSQVHDKNTPSLELGVIIHALEEIIKTTIQNDDDLRLVYGKLD